MLLAYDACCAAAVAQAGTAKLSIGGTSQVVVHRLTLFRSTPVLSGHKERVYCPARYVTDVQTSEIGLSGWGGVLQQFDPLQDTGCLS